MRPSGHVGSAPWDDPAPARDEAGRQICGAVTKHGDFCMVNFGLSPTNGRCKVHDDERRAALTAARRKGGRAASRARSRSGRTVRAVADFAIRLARIEQALARIEAKLTPY